MNFSISNQKKIQIHLYTILQQGINIIFIDQLPNYLIFKKYILC